MSLSVVVLCPLIESWYDGWPTSLYENSWSIVNIHTRFVYPSFYLNVISTCKETKMNFKCDVQSILTPEMDSLGSIHTYHYGLFTSNDSIKTWCWQAKMGMQPIEGATCLRYTDGDGVVPCEQTFRAKRYPWIDQKQRRLADQCCSNSAMTLVILLLLKTTVSLENGL